MVFMLRSAISGMGTFMLYFHNTNPLQNWIRDFTYTTCTTYRLTAGQCQKHCYTGMHIDKWLLLSLTSSDRHGTAWVNRLGCYISQGYYWYHLRWRPTCTCPCDCWAPAQVTSKENLRSHLIRCLSVTWTSGCQATELAKLLRSSNIPV